MTDYVKSTNFTSKDSLPSGNALKIIKGTEFDVEFNNIVTAVSTKADSISPTLSGVPTAPTATAGTDTTQIASTAFVNAAIVPKANLASPTFTGVPAAPTATAGTNTTQLATTAFVTAADTVAVTSAVSQAATAAAAAYPTKSGSGATGTWGINISGNAATATNATNASYATTAGNGGVTSVNGATGAVTVSVLGNGQTWQDVSGSRVNGTTYQNTTGRSIMVSLGNSLNSDVQVSTDGSTWIQVGREVAGSTYPNQFIVPNNHYYRTSSAGGTRFWWSELR